MRTPRFIRLAILPLLLSAGCSGEVIPGGEDSSGDYPGADGGGLGDPSSVDASTSGGTTGAAFFRADSLWNTPISTQSVQWQDQPGLRSTCWWVNSDSFSNPVVVSSSSDPLVSVTVQNSWGWPAGVLQLHIPTGQNGANGTDGELTVIDGDTAYDFWIFVRDSATTGHATSWAQNNIVTGSGWGSPSPFLGAGIRAGGSSTLAGLIVRNELTTGIHHALAVAVTPGSGLFGGHALPPAINSDGPNEGLRLGIPPGTPKPSGLSTQGSNLWDALETYGAWVADAAGGNCTVVLSTDPNSVPAADVGALLNDLSSIMQSVKVVDFQYPYAP